MKRIYNLVALFSVLFVSCAEDEAISGLDKQADSSLTVYLKAGSDLVTRNTHLISSDNRQHAKYVQLYVFNKTGVCVQSRNINWTQGMGSTAKQSYVVSGLNDGEEYTLLAVALDEDPVVAGTTYGLPDAITVNTTTLAGLNAVLAEGKTRADIAVSELFSGWEDVKAGTTLGVTINLYRRVSGLLAYLKDIPSEVATIRINLYKNQYKDVPLQKADKTNMYDTNDHGQTELENSRTVISMAVDDAVKNATALDDGQGYTITKQTGTLLQGAYILPVEAPASASAYTLTLETLRADGSVLQTYQVKMLGKTEAGGSITETLLTNYPLYANQFYSIGKKDATTDEPISLGEDLVITVDPMWEGIDDAIPLE